MCVSACRERPLCTMFTFFYFDFFFSFFLQILTHSVPLNGPKVPCKLCDFRHVPPLTRGGHKGPHPHPHHLVRSNADLLRFLPFFSFFLSQYVFVRVSVYLLHGESKKKKSCVSCCVCVFFVLFVVTHCVLVHGPRDISRNLAIP